MPTPAVFHHGHGIGQRTRIPPHTFQGFEIFRKRRSCSRQGRRLFGGSIRKIDAERRSPDPVEPLNRQNEKPGWLARLFSTE
jgi:hypothetical protein